MEFPPFPNPIHIHSLQILLPMKSEKKVGYLIILNYLLISATLGLCLWQFFMRAQAPVKLSQSSLISLPAPPPIGLCDIPPPPPPSLELQPEIILKEKTYKSFDERMAEVENEPIPDIRGEFLDGEFYRSNYHVNRAFDFQDLYKRIKYPDIAKDVGIQGIVVLRVYIDENGEYKNHKVLQTPHPILTKTVEKEIAHLKIKPFTEDGRGRKIVVNLPFRFHYIR